MDSNVIWGVVLIAYVVPYFFWMISRDQTLEIRRKLYPARKQEVVFDGYSTRYGLLWSIGLALLIVGWWIKVTALGALVLFVFWLLVVGLAILLRRRKQLLTIQSFRFWAAGTGIWLLAVIAWYLVFMHDTSLRNYQFALIGLLPPTIAVAAIVALRWAKAGSHG